MALFADMVAYQEEVRDPSRVAEVLNRESSMRAVPVRLRKSTCRVIIGRK